MPVSGGTTRKLLERRLPPAQQHVALAVALEFQQRVDLERVARCRSDPPARSGRSPGRRAAADWRGSGSAPMAARASRMAARSTTHGTPVKSCSSTRAGMKLISFASRPAAPRAPRSRRRRPKRACRLRGAAGFRAGSWWKTAGARRCRRPVLQAWRGGKYSYSRVADAQLRRRAKTVFCHPFDCGINGYYCRTSTVTLLRSAALPRKYPAVVTAMGMQTKAAVAAPWFWLLNSPP